MRRLFPSSFFPQNRYKKTFFKNPNSCISNKDLKYEWLDGSVAPADSVPWDWPHRPPVEGHGPGRCGYMRKGMVRTWGDCGWKTNYVCKKGGGACAGPDA